MAFIRNYQARSMALGSLRGDPGLGKFFKRAFTPPKAIRKLQVGKALGSVARVALPLVGGPIGGLAAGLIGGGGGGGGARAARQTFGDLILAHLAAQGFPVFSEAGDPTAAEMRRAQEMAAQFGGNRPRSQRPGATPKPAKRRASAAKPPSVKAATKGGFDLTGALEMGQDLLTNLLGMGGAKGAAQKAGRDASRGLQDMLGLPPLPSDLGFIPQMGRRGAPRIPGMRTRSRRTNPANVKALRRGLRRIESFNNLVKSVHRTLPRLAPSPGRPVVRAKGRKR